LIAKNDKKMRIEVGYGLEGILPDSLVGSIGRDYLAAFFKQGKYSEAESVYKRLIYIKEKEGEDEKAISLRLELASVFEMQGKYDRAEAIYNTAIAFWKERNNNTRAASTRIQLAKMHLKKKKYFEANALYKEAIESIENNFGKDHTLVKKLQNDYLGALEAIGVRNMEKPPIWVWVITSILHQIDLEK